MFSRRSGRVGGRSDHDCTFRGLVERPSRTLRHTPFPLPGCELSGHTRSFTFKVEEEDDAEHVLALTMVRFAGKGGE